MPPPLILASTSRYRREQLERLGLPFEAVAPACDEEALKRAGTPPHRLAVELALAKARSIAAQRPEAVVIGGDQVCALGSEILGKPGSRANVVAQLARLAGRSHELITAICVAHPGGTIEHAEIAHLAMRALPPEAIARYVAADDPVDCAGAYKLERRGIALFERIDCADHSAITGLPLIALTRILVGLGYDAP